MNRLKFETLPGSPAANSFNDMRGKIYAAEALVLMLAARTYAQVYQTNVVGYVNVNFTTGSNLFNNPLQVTGSTNTNDLNDVFNHSFPSVPVGTTVSLWDPATAAFETSSAFTNGSWTTNLILPPGTGALVIAPSPFTNTIEGDVLGHDGSPNIDLDVPFPPPPLYMGPNGLFLLGDKAPTTDTGTNIFLNIVGRLPFVGEQVITLSGTNTYLGNGVWDSVPTLLVGSSAFLNIKSEPPPFLMIVYENGQTIVSWPPTTSVWTLQTNNDLTSGTWVNYAGTIINNSVTNSDPTGNLFYRLTYP
jgi:hypothetical protein